MSIYEIKIHFPLDPNKKGGTQVYYVIAENLMSASEIAEKRSGGETKAASLHSTNEQSDIIFKPIQTLWESFG